MNLPGIYKIFLAGWKDLQTCWIISDTHFDDKDLCQGIHNRPSDEELVKIINSKCGKNDLLIHLGDVGDIECVKKLRAKRKILIMGNHDSGRTNYERCWWQEWFKKENFQKHEAIAEIQKMYPNCRYTVEEWEASWVIKADNMLFDEVYEGPLMIAEKLILSHEKIDVPWAFNIHGHDHAGRKSDKRHLNVCSDVIGHEPVNLNQFMKSGAFAHIESLHRDTINGATERKRKRDGKKIGER